MSTKSSEKGRSGSWCCVPLCKRHGGLPGIKMLCFPRPFEEREKWVKRIRREDWQPKFSSRICSWHFPTHDRKLGPTRFDWNEGKSFALNFPNQQPGRKKRKQVHDPIQIEFPTIVDNDPCLECQRLTAEVDTLNKLLENIKSELDETKRKLEEKVSEFEHLQEIQMEESDTRRQLIEAENCIYVMKEEIHLLKKCTLTYEIVKTHKKFDRLTGITISTFNVLFGILKNKPITYEFGWRVSKISLEDQMLIFLMKMRMNLTFDFLSIIFGKTRKTITNVFYTFLYFFYHCFYMETMTKIPKLDQVQPSLPAAFKDFPDCRIIIDCTEFLIEPSKLLSHKCATFSNYKKRNSFKNLIGIVPNGTIVFVSECYGGSTSDKAIVNHSNFLNLMEIGDMVMADKGFLLHDIMPNGVSLVTPDFLVNQQFTADQVKKTNRSRPPVSTSKDPFRESVCLK